MMNTYFPILCENSKKPTESMIDYLTQVQPYFNCPEELLESFEIYLQSLQTLIKRILPPKLKLLAEDIDYRGGPEDVHPFYDELEKELPLFSWSNKAENPPYILSITTLCHASFTHGVGRFLANTFSKRLIPGKNLDLPYSHSMAFQFRACPSLSFFLQEHFVKIHTKEDLDLVYSHLSQIASEVRLNISAVQHARKVISLKPLTLEQKRMIIQENIASLLNQTEHEPPSSLFDQMQDFLTKVSAEEKVSQIKEQIAPLLELRSSLFARDIFWELQNIVSHFKESFIANRKLRHLTRMIAYAYLFRKAIKGLLLTAPNQRHLNFKILHFTETSGSDKKKCLGILVGINTLRENEIIGEKHLLKAIQSILPDVEKKQASSFTDKRDSDVRLLYMEIYKPMGSFSLQDIKHLRARLPREIKTRIESVINPIFMPKNEEEVMRNILVLSNQLKYMQDIPHVIITFHKQSDTLLSFTIILLRILKPEDPPLQKLFSKLKQGIKITDHEVKTVGILRKKYPKEANVFEMHLKKNPFLRKDFSVDLSSARRAVYNKLIEILGDVRDYNGGMISKQGEALSQLKKLLLQINVQNDFLLENFFYSLTPNYMQSIINPHILKKLFVLFLEALEHDYSTQSYFLKTQIVQHHFLITMGAVNPSFKEFIEQRLETFDVEASSLTSSYINVYDISCLSYILRFTDSDQHQAFLQKIIESVKVWHSTLQQKLPLTNENFAQKSKLIL